jgi:hypothetical protein
MASLISSGIQLRTIGPENEQNCLCHPRSEVVKELVRKLTSSSERLTLAVLVNYISEYVGNLPSWRLHLVMEQMSSFIDDLNGVIESTQIDQRIEVMDGVTVRSLSITQNPITDFISVKAQLLNVIGRPISQEEVDARRGELRNYRVAGTEIEIYTIRN